MTVISVLSVVVLGIAGASRIAPPAGTSPVATLVRSADLVMQDRDDGSVAVLRADDRGLVDVIPPATNGFLRVLLTGLVRERRREGIGAPSVPFHLTQWSDGRLTIDDTATRKLIELDAFGPDNVAAFARLLDLSRPLPAM